MKFTVECEMDDSYVPAFLSMLRTMEAFGKNGKDTPVGMMVDGIAGLKLAFRPNVETPFLPPEPAAYSEGRYIFNRACTYRFLELMHSKYRPVLTEEGFKAIGEVLKKWAQFQGKVEKDNADTGRTV